jgi:hypothetical protein
MPAMADPRERWPTAGKQPTCGGWRPYSYALQPPALPHARTHTRTPERARATMLECICVRACVMAGSGKWLARTRSRVRAGGPRCEGGRAGRQAGGRMDGRRAGRLGSTGGVCCNTYYMSPRLGSWARLLRDIHGPDRAD